MGVYLNGEGFYLTVDRDCAGSNFVAQIEVAEVNPKKWVLLKPNPNKRTIAIGQAIEWRVKETKGKEDPVGGRILLIKLAIDKTERLAVEKAKHARYVSTVDNSAVLKLTADSDVGDSSVVWSSDGGPSGEGLTLRLIKSKKFPPIGKYRIRATCSKVPAYYDEYTVVVVRTAFIVYVDQPGKGGDRQPYEVDRNGNYDVGHVWWEFRTSNIEIAQEGVQKELVNQPTGYYSKQKIQYPRHLSAPGIVVIPDEQHTEEVSHEWEIGMKSFLKGLQYVEKFKANPGTYAVTTFNCTDAAIKVGSSAGVSVPDNPSSIRYEILGISRTIDDVSNAGDLGEDLRLLNKRK